MLEWFRALMPKEDRFFELFARYSLTLVAGAEALRQLLDGGETVTQHCREIVEREHEADEITRLNEITEEITRIEGKADDLHDEGLKALFRAQASANPMAFVIGNEIYDHLEMVVDRFDDVANEISSLVIEHV